MTDEVVLPIFTNTIAPNIHTNEKRFNDFLSLIPFHDLKLQR